MVTRFEKAFRRAERILTMSETDKAYIAGLMDGEGTIGIHKGKRRDLAPRVQIANSNIELLKWLKEKLGFGYIHRREYTCCYYDVKSLLTATLPYLRLKKRQAELALEFINLRLARESWWNPYTERELQIRERVLELNEKPKLTKRIPSEQEVASYLRTHPLEVTIPAGE